MNISISDILSIIAILISLIISVYNILLNRKIYKPKIQILFEEVGKYNSEGVLWYGAATKYNIIVTNQSNFNLYNFKIECTYNGIPDKEINKHIGFLNTELATFVNGQKYISYFEDIKELRELGCEELTFNMKYKLHPKRKKVYREQCVISTGALRNTRYIYKEDF